MPDIAHHDASVRHDREISREGELAGTIAGPADRPEKVTAPVDDHDPQRVAVHEIQVALTIKSGFVDRPELLPLLAVQRPDPVHLFEIGVEHEVLRR